jgi:outer membrane receptor for ferrienterochelin and colicins
MRIVIVSIFIGSFLSSFAQTDSTILLNEVFVTATRTQRKLVNVAVPASIIAQKNIQQAGSLRLNDILGEQAGLFLTAGFGTGVQMQGLNPDYTLILLNGEPLIGRNAGVLDLNRITVGNIKKIEIIKGPSSSLYGSEAMAGVINIITHTPTKSSLQASVRYGTYNTTDANINVNSNLGKLRFNYFTNSYSSNGFSIRPFSVERTVAPLWRLTNQLQLNFPVSHKTQASLMVRHNYQDINNKIAVTNTGGTVISDGQEVQKDLNVNGTVIHQFNSKIQSSLRTYYSNFNALQSLKTNAAINYRDYFNQHFLRVENQTDYEISNKLNLTAGTGFIIEQVNSNRYDDEKSNKQNQVFYGFGQAEYKASNKLTTLLGLRYDKNTVFASAFSPKLAVNYKASNKWIFNFSVGRGFKAPDFRQLYLSFTNTAAGSYSVFGVEEAKEQIALLQSQGRIGSVENDFYKLGNLKPEYSTGFNAGFTFIPNKKIQLQANFFRNDIENMIDTRLVAYYNSGAQIFSYLNINKAFTQGVEINSTYKINNKLTLSSGYQFLMTADKQQIENIKKGLVFTKDVNGFARLMQRSEYVGLPNRSSHMANLKLLYEYNNFFINTRAIYRSKWAVSDKDGNGLYNTNDEFANGFVQLNLSVGYQFKKYLSLQAGTDNLSNYTDATNLPNLPGRTFYITIQFKTTKK